MTRVSVELAPNGVWAVRTGGRLFASPAVVLLDGGRVEMIGAREVPLPAEPTPYEAALAALFPPGSRARWQDLGLLRDAEVLAAPSFDRRTVRTEHGEREVHLSELRAC